MYVNRAGRLKNEFLPAVYFDSSVLIDYWMTESLEVDRPKDPLLERITKQTPMETAIRDLLRPDARIQKVVEIRKRLVSGSARASAVISPISLLELMEWNADSAFRNIAAQTAGAMFMQRRGKKDIGDYLKMLFALRRNEVRKQESKTRQQATESDGLERFMGYAWLNPGFSSAYGLRGLIQADIANFRMPIRRAWQDPSAYAYLQLGVSDIMHILFAQHLGCKYLASFDSDFRRVADIVEEETAMKILSTPEEIHDIL